MQLLLLWRRRRCRLLLRPLLRCRHSRLLLLLLLLPLLRCRSRLRRRRLWCHLLLLLPLLLDRWLAVLLLLLLLLPLLLRWLLLLLRPLLRCRRNRLLLSLLLPLLLLRRLRRMRSRSGPLLPLLLLLRICLCHSSPCLLRLPPCRLLRLGGGIPSRLRGRLRKRGGRESGAARETRRARIRTGGCHQELPSCRRKLPLWRGRRGSR